MSDLRQGCWTLGWRTDNMVNEDGSYAVGIRANEGILVVAEDPI